MKGPLFENPCIKKRISHDTHHKLSQELYYLKSCLCTFFTLKCKREWGSAVVAGIVQVHIKFQFYVPQSAQTCSCSESLMVIVVNGVVYFDNSVVFGYSVG